MPTVTSADGTTIAYESAGDGQALILVDGALCYRAAGPMRALAELLHDDFTVVTYDRRGRGDSSDTLPYAIDREVEDLQALIARVGGEACVYTMSSGGAIGLATAAAGPGITKLALFEPPFVAEVEEGTRFADYTERLTELLAARRHGDAVALFMANVGIPEGAIAGMRCQPGWDTLETIAQTLAYDDALLAGGRIPHHLAAVIDIPVVVLSGGASPEGLQQAAKETAYALPCAMHRALPGQRHDVAPQALAPVLVELFGV